MVIHELSEPQFSHLRIGDGNKSCFSESNNQYHRLYHAVLRSVHYEGKTTTRLSHTIDHKTLSDFSEAETHIPESANTMLISQASSKN